MTPKILLSRSKSGAENYEKAVRAVGGEPTALYCPPADVSYDGLILCGGDDVDPARFGQENCGSQGIDPERDASEFALIEAYVAAKKPILGICRGHQILNVALGGSLIQDLDGAVRPFHSHDPAQKGDKVHPVRALEGSWFARTWGGLFPVNSSHHQAVDAVGGGLVPALWSEGGVVEGMVHTSLPILCVQFHPERMSFDLTRPDTVDGSPIFHWLMEQCRNKKGSL